MVQRIVEAVVAAIIAGLVLSAIDYNKKNFLDTGYEKIVTPQEVVVHGQAVGGRDGSSSLHRELSEVLWTI